MFVFLRCCVFKGLFEKTKEESVSQLEALYWNYEGPNLISHINSKFLLCDLLFINFQRTELDHPSTALKLVKN